MLLLAPVKCHHCFYWFFIPLWSARVSTARVEADVRATVAGQPRKAA
jgi:hypothetical protein